MSLDKAIEHKKEHRKQYRGAKRYSLLCRQNICPFCRGNKLYKNKKRLEKAKYNEY